MEFSILSNTFFFVYHEFEKYIFQNFFLFNLREMFRHHSRRQLQVVALAMHGKHLFLSSAPYS